MLTGEHSLTYYPDTLADGTSTGPPDHIVIGYKQNNIEEDLIVKFDPDSDRIAFFETANRHLASAEFTIDKADTMLVFTNDSLPQKRMIFIKYDMNHCPHVPSYFHLVNDKFIAGKY
ncbi:MAG: hypothetical protein JWO03_3841, partial [Bacteroidetes bacterium]|nr:hypothetical protein [Bacteroidota bacterium]